MYLPLVDGIISPFHILAMSRPLECSTYIMEVPLSFHLNRSYPSNALEEVEYNHKWCRSWPGLR